MPRKRKETPSGYDKAFPTVMRDLMKQRGTTQNELANYLQKTRQAISYYCDGSSSPDWETLVKIADYFNTSTDYLLGRTEDPYRQPSAIDELGLSEEAITGIRYCNSSGRIHGLNLLLGNYRFNRLVGEIGDFSNAVSCNLGVSKAYQNTASAESETKIDDFRFRHSLDEEAQARALTELMEKHFPDLKGRVSVLIGSYAVESQKRSIVDSFDEILRHISKYDELRSNVFRFGDLWEND